MRHAPKDKTPQTQATDTFVCGEGENETHSAIGCQQRFPFSQFNIHSNLCFTCNNQLANDYGVDRKNADFVRTAKFNERYYTNATPGFEKYDNRTRVRILIMAIGCPVMNASEEEHKAAAKMKILYAESLGMTWNNSELESLTRAIN